MKRKYQEFLVLIIIFLIYLGIFFKPSLIIDSSINSINIFKTKLFPTIFPFFTLATLMLELGYASKISYILNPIFKKLFHADGYFSFIVLVSLISGFPSGSKYVDLCYKRQNITKDIGNYLLTFTHFPNPLFVLGSVSLIIKDISLAYKILFITIISNLLLGIILRPKNYITSEISSNEKISLKEALPKAINEAIKLLLFMFGSITFFMFISKLVSYFFYFNNFFEVVFTGILDMTSGISISSILNIDQNVQSLIILSFINFGGASIHLQVLNNIKEEDLEYKYFFFGRIISTAIAIVLFIIF